MKDYFIIDSHCDTLGQITDRKADLKNHELSHITLDGLKSGNIGLQFFAAWVGPKTKYSPCLQRGLILIDSFFTMLDTYPDFFMKVSEFDDIQNARSSNKVGAMLTVEGGDILEGELINLRILYKLGVRAMTLTWNYRNELADGVLEDCSKGGLSTFGLEVISEMNRLGMLIDVSHLSERGFYDVMEYSLKPIAATHSNAWSVYQHPRNLKDEQIREISRNKGVIGINFYPSFLAREKANSDDIIRHIEYIAALGGIDIIGFGTDFDGIEEVPEDINGPENLGIIVNKLLRLNYKEDDIKKITCNNYMRLLKEVL